MSLCKCGQEAHPLYNGKCEDCWVEPYTSGRTSSSQSYGVSVVFRVNTSGLPNDDIGNYWANAVRALEDGRC